MLDACVAPGCAVNVAPLELVLDPETRFKVTSASPDRDANAGLGRVQRVGKRILARIVKT